MGLLSWAVEALLLFRHLCTSSINCVRKEYWSSVKSGSNVVSRRSIAEERINEKEKKNW